jgi:glycosyltransferase involved in cell wall biosynthesis
MLSICIPVYNFNVTELVTSLHNEAETLAVEYEIVLSDDASSAVYQNANSLLSGLSNVRFLRSETNLGRTKNRNKLFETARYPYILFMDCDSKISKIDYIKDYLPYCLPGSICQGGRIYDAEKPADNKLVLHWKVGRSRESWPANVRAEKPNNSFMTCNFLIDKDIFNIVQFDERLQGYGNEDTLFGIALMKKDIRISHIDNPLYHVGLEASDVFLSKIEESLRCYHKINFLYDNDPQFIESCKILRVEKKIKRWHLVGSIKRLFIFFRKVMSRNLTGKNPRLFVYDLYRLGYLCYCSAFEII